MEDKFEKYKSLSNAEVKARATELGLEFGRTEKIDNIIERIVEVEVSMPPVTSLKKEQKKEQKVTHEPEDIVEKQQKVIDFCRPLLGGNMRVEFHDNVVKFVGGLHPVSVHISSKLDTIYSSAVYAHG